MSKISNNLKERPKQIEKNLENYRKWLKKPERKKLVSSRFKEMATGEDTDLVWHQRIANTLAWRENHWNGTKNWNRAFELYEGKHWEDTDDFDVEIVKSDNRRDRITVNITNSSVQNMVPFLMASGAKFACKPRKPSSGVSATLQEAVLNYEWEQREMQEQCEEAVLDAVICGHGWVRTGFTLELDAAIRKAEGDINYADYIRKEAPYSRRVSPYNVIFDPVAPDNTIRTARWMAEIHYVPIRDILANSNYLKSTLQAIDDGDYELTTKEAFLPDHNYDEPNDLPEDELGVIVEIWDKKWKKYRVYAMGVIEPLVEKPWPYPYLDGFPYEMFQFVKVPNCPFPMGLALAIEDQQLELNTVRTRMFQHGRRFNRKYQALDKVEPEEVDKLADGEDGCVILVPQIGAIAPIQDAVLSTDHQVIEAIIKDDIRSLTSQDALISGGNLPSRTTAGEVNARGSLFRMKLDGRANSIDRSVNKVGVQTLQHIKSNYLTDKIVKIVGNQGEYWVEYSVEDIQDDVDVSMESISAPKIDPILDRQQALQVFQIIMSQLPILMQLKVPIDIVELFKWLFRKIGDKDIARFFNPLLTPDAPLEEQPVQGVSNNLKQLPPANTEVSSVEDLQRQGGLAPLLNASGLQL